MDLVKKEIFASNIYYLHDDRWLNGLKKDTKKYLDEIKNKNLLSGVADFGFAHQSDELKRQTEFKDFSNFICQLSYDILDTQGYDMNYYFMKLDELWVQKFSKDGGANHNTHTHWNGHISGFYFLEVSKNTSFPIFHDPRPGKLMCDLHEKKRGADTSANPSFMDREIKPGTFIFFNSFLPHEFSVDFGIEDFSFVHFNIKAYSKDLLYLNLN
jgi:uncharacterized protein (TIGR02466 family)